MHNFQVTTANVTDAISKNQMYAKCSTAIKEYRGTPFFNIQILNPQQSAYLRLIKSKTRRHC